MEIGFRLVLVDRCLLYHLLRHRSQFNLDHRVFQKQVKLSLSLFLFETQKQLQYELLFFLLDFGTNSSP